MEVKYPLIHKTINNKGRRIHHQNKVVGKVLLSVGLDNKTDDLTNSKRTTTQYDRS
jgi:hypothetical protein